MAIRREGVRLELEDDVTPGLLRMAAAAELADNKLKGIGKGFGPNMRSATRDIDGQGKAFEDYERRARQAERTSSLMADTAVTLGPAFGGAAALAVPALAGLTAQLGFTVAGIGTAILAFNGIGDAIKATNEYNLDPTAVNLDKMNAALDKLGPSGQEFVKQLDDLEPRLKQLKIAAENGLLPGVGDGLDHLLVLLPQVRDLIGEVSGTVGDLASEAGQSLGSEKFDEFFIYLQQNAKPILTDLGETVGHVAAGMANLLVDFAPQERGFSDYLNHIARGFEDWSAGLSKTEGYENFLNFLARTGPEVGHALGSISSAVVAVAKAGAPLSGPTLDALASLADLVAKIADSPIGTPLVTLASGIALVNRALATSALAKNSLVADLLLGKQGAGAGGLGRGVNALERTRSSIRGLTSDVGSYFALQRNIKNRSPVSAAELDEQATAATRLKGNLAGLAKGTAAVGGLALASTGAADGIRLTNTAAGALIGTIGGPWGIALGAGVGAVMDLSDAVDKQKQSFKEWAEAAPTQKLRETREELEKQKAAFEGRTATQNLVSAGAGYGASGSSQNEMSGKDVRRLAAINRELSFRNAQEGAANLVAISRGFGLTSAGAETATQDIADFTAAATKMTNRLAGRADLRAFEQAIDDFSSTLRKNGRTLDINAQKGRDNQAALDGIASTALAVAETLKGVDRVQFLTRARRQFIQAAEAAGLTRAAARALADEVLGLNGITGTPKITVKTAAAISAITAVKAGLNALDGDTANTFINTIHTEVFKHASGGRIRGPGSGTSDSIPALLSNGEGVLRAATMTHYDQMWGPGWFDELNAMRFATGGRVPKHKKQPKIALSSVVAASAGVNLATLQAQDAIAGDQQQIDDLLDQLNEQKLIGKKGHKHYVYAAVGSARTALETQLRVAVSQLAQDKAALAAGTYSGGPLENAASDAQQAIDDANAAAQQLADNKLQTISTYNSNLNFFSRGTSALGGERAAAQFLGDVTTYKNALQSLISAGAGAGLLNGVERVAETGDYRSAAKLANSFINDPIALGQTNAIYGQAQAALSGIANLVNSGAFAATNTGTRSVDVDFNFLQDPSSLAAEMARIARHEVTTAIVQATS